MSTPVWALLVFAGWTLLTLLGTVGLYRWSRILTGRAGLADFPADDARGSDWYRRAMRAHANCVENLPVFGAIVVAILASGASGRTLDVLSLGVVAGRVGQTLIHVSVPQTNAAVGVRFAFFFAQLLAMGAMGALVALHAAG